ncbi:hypothetical protein BZA77DRAFT_62381 [Pyronema omphalodes]|nr:hypothetical protein BZA77DRAFT_62381 [Pyronema omphalodes]
MDLKMIIGKEADPIPSLRDNTYYTTSGTTAVTPHRSMGAMTPKSISSTGDIKRVYFQLRDNNTYSKSVQFRPSDNTQSIYDTLRNLFGMGTCSDPVYGISFEYEDGVSFVPSYDNFADRMTVYVRIERNVFKDTRSYDSAESYPVHPGHPSRSVTPTVPPEDRRPRSASETTLPHELSNSRKRSERHDEGTVEPQNWYTPRHHSLGSMHPEEGDSRYKVAPAPSADISLENIVEGNRRKRLKFSSDDIPLYPPPGPQYRDGASLSPTRQLPQLPTPYSIRNGSVSHTTPPYHSAYSHQGHRYGPPAHPTPAPTVGSMSDEDVAMQLMNLGCYKTAPTDINSSRDDARLSDGGEYVDDGRSDTASLPEILPPILKIPPQRGLPDSPILYPRNNSASYFNYAPPPAPPAEEVEELELDEEAISDASTARKDESDNEDADYEEDELDDLPIKYRKELHNQPVAPAPPVRKASLPAQPKPKPAAPTPPKGIAKATKRPSPITKPKKKASISSASSKSPIKQQQEYPITPTSLPDSRKPSVASSASSSSGNTASKILSLPISNFPTMTTSVTPAKETTLLPPFEEEDIKAKPRCQRCRKSKKGCNRQRPCQRCHDAGIPDHECVSEDEVGTRRGRTAAAQAAKKTQGKPKKESSTSASASASTSSQQSQSQDSTPVPVSAFLPGSAAAVFAAARALDQKQQPAKGKGKKKSVS